MAQDRVRVPGTTPSGQARSTNRIGDWVAPICSVDGVVKRNTFALKETQAPIRLSV
jgi:hypothetical protein